MDLRHAHLLVQEGGRTKARSTRAGYNATALAKRLVIGHRLGCGPEFATTDA